jgi:hypothetical protein
MILGATNQKLWVFEVFRRSLGRAGMCWSQSARVDHMRKKWAGGKKNLEKREQSSTGQESIRDLAAVGAGRRLACQAMFFFFEFFIFF